jgi:hypothetical protein
MWRDSLAADEHEGVNRLWTPQIVVYDPRVQDPAQVTFVERDQPVQTFPPDRPDEPLTEPIRLRRSHGRLQYAQPHRSDRAVDDIPMDDPARADIEHDEHMDHSAVYPELSRIRDCSHAVACAVIRRAVAEGHASPGILPGLEETVSRAMWSPTYRPIRFHAHDGPGSTT